MPFIRHHIEMMEKLPFDWKWHIVEGAAAPNHDTDWCKQVPDEFHRNGLSVDGTTEYIDELAVRFPGRLVIHRKHSGFWDGKLEMVNAPMGQIPDDSLLWEIDTDEIWTTRQVEKVWEVFNRRPDLTAAWFRCHYFVGPGLVITSRNTYGGHDAYEWRRAWRFRKGYYWGTHEPPRLLRHQDCTLLDVSEIKPLAHAETEAMGLVFQHYAYATERQVAFKEKYYGYQGAVEQWKRLQETKHFPVKLANYFAWVKDETVVGTAALQGITEIFPLREQ